MASHGSEPDLAEALELRDELLLACRDVLLSVGSRQASWLTSTRCSTSMTRPHPGRNANPMPRPAHGCDRPAPSPNDPGLWAHARRCGATLASLSCCELRSVCHAGLHPGSRCDPTSTRRRSHVEAGVHGPRHRLPCDPRVGREPYLSMKTLRMHTVDLPVSSACRRRRRSSARHQRRANHQANLRTRFGLTRPDSAARLVVCRKRRRRRRVGASSCRRSTRRRWRQPFAPARARR